MSKKLHKRMYPTLMSLLMIQGEEPDQSNVVKKLRARIGRLPFGLGYVPFTELTIKKLKRNGTMYALVIQFELKNLKSTEMVRELFHVRKFFYAVKDLLLELAKDIEDWLLLDVEQIHLSEDQLRY